MSVVRAGEKDKLALCCLLSEYMPSSVAFGHWGSLLNKPVVQVLILKFKFIGNMLDDSSFFQSVAVPHSFTTVRSKANLDKPVHQLTAKEDSSRGFCTTPSVFDNASDTNISMIMNKLLTGYPDFLRYWRIRMFCCFSITPEEFKPSFEWQND